MNNNDIFNYALTIASKDDRGNTISPDERTYLLQKVSNMFFNDKCKEFEKSRIIGDALIDLVKELSVTTDSSGVASVPNDYVHLLPFMYGSKAVDVVSKSESITRRGSVILSPSDDNPICSVFNSNLNFYPQQVYTDAEIRYIAQPTPPCFDYYVDANGYTKYLTAGQIYTLQEDEVYRDGTTSGQVTSISKELEFPDNYKDQVTDYLITQIGIYLEDQGLVQLGAKEESKTLQP